GAAEASGGRARRRSLAAGSRRPRDPPYRGVALVRSRSALPADGEASAPRQHALEAAWSFLRHAPFGVIAIDRDATVLAINPAASKLLGYSSEEVEGEAVARILRAPRGESHVPPGACAAPEEAREVEVVTRSGDVLPVGLRLLPLEALDGSLQGTIALFQDLREQKALEEQWRRRDRLASLGALAAGVAHEIRNPLAGIGTSAQVMKRRLEVGDRIGARRPARPLDLVEVRVRDNGPGIPAAVLARVFDPFYTTRTQGTGLGLSICQTIIREHGGSISIESVVGQGTQVLIDLP